MAQRFNVDWKFEVEEKSVFINAATIFDVAGDSVKDYKLSIYALKACNVKFTIFFKNPTTHEFISFKIVTYPLILESRSFTIRSNELDRTVIISSRDHTQVNNFREPLPTSNRNQEGDDKC